MVKVQWLPKAQKDLDRLYAFIEPYSQATASLAISTLLNATKTLAKFPEQGRLWDQEMNLRELFVKFGARGYVIRYQYINDEVSIVRAWHALENRQVN